MLTGTLSLKPVPRALLFICGFRESRFCVRIWSERDRQTETERVLHVAPSGLELQFTSAFQVLRVQACATHPSESLVIIYVFLEWFPF
jgi:hypothetical protein